MANKQGLIDYLLKHGKNLSWSTLALKFGFDNHDNARKCWSKYRRSIPSSEDIDALPAYIDRYPVLGVPIVTTTSAMPIRHHPFPLSKDEVLAEIRNTVVKSGAYDLAKKFMEMKEGIRMGSAPSGYMLELAIFDLHIGKLAWEDEVGEDYNIEIAVKRYKDAIRGMLAHVNIASVERILLPIGNDMIHVDSRKNTTFAGTPQDCDGRFLKMVKVAKELLINTIDELSLIAPVDVVVIHGNHDTHTMFCIGEILDAFYHGSATVTINNEPTQRKYYSYGTTAIQFTHGNEERHNDLGLIFATEKPHMWGLSKYRFSQLGHFHKNKKVSYTSVEDLTGFTLQILPSLSGADAWHTSKGYHSKKQAKAFLFSKENGMVAEYTYNA